MSESLWLDPAQMDAMAAGLDQLAEEAAQMMNELQGALADQGECWGNDDPGKIFAQSYVPAARQGMEGLENLVANVRAMGPQVRNITDTLENQDAMGAPEIRGADPTAADPTPAGPVGTDPVGANPTGAADPTASPTTAYPDRNPSAGPSRTPTDSMNDRSVSPDPATSANQQQPAAQQQPAQQPDSGDANSPGNDPGSDPDTRGQQPTTYAPDTPAPNTATPAKSAADAPARPGSAPGNPNTADPTTAARGTAARSPAETPWSRNSARAQSSSAPKSASPAENQTPPRVSPPRAPERPPNSAKPGEEKKLRTTPPRREPPAARPRPVTDDEAMRILREMAARHDLDLTGFETAGIAEQTAQDIADAVHSVLTKHPITLSGLAISEGGPLSRVENRSDATASGSSHGSSRPPEPWIVLTRAAAADPGLLIERDGVATQSADDKLRRRPMYTTMLLELGHALDLTGGLRARREVQRALITEYLRVSGAQRDNLGRIVSGYKHWRSQLGDHCFDDGALAPGQALAAGFVTVELQGSDAHGPAKVLHRLLVVMARAALQHGR
ncbi:WXG100 family type VII secretion target [Nocardia mexicana]|uniref:WXG100 family type VII secretion target n=1 Tax=Nocardia mexicana TaxID=279262 RepID=A0A370HH57_9NOCA|nr:hypothetical protein [Nocardia mexicana]RDI54504.1 hypothetical protein DFR68_102632 [Nocardia mexicana]